MLLVTVLESATTLLCMDYNQNFGQDLLAEKALLADQRR